MMFIGIFVIMGVYAFWQYRKTHDKNHLWGLRISVTVLIGVVVIYLSDSPIVVYGTIAIVWFGLPYVMKRWLK